MTKANKIQVSILSAALAVFSFGFSANAQSAPSLSAQSVDVTGPHNIRIYVTVNPNGSPTDVSFKYKTGSSSFRNSVYRNITHPMTIQNWGLIGLLEGTTYSYQIEARNSYGMTTGSTGTFTTMGSSTNNSGGSGGNTSTLEGAPLVATNGPVSVSATSAVVNGSINPNNTSTDFWFEFGTSSSLGQKTSVQNIGSGNTWQLVTGNFNGLQSGTTYYYKVAAQNTKGTAYGEVKSFTAGSGNTGSGGQVLGTATGNRSTNTGTRRSTNTGNNLTSGSASGNNSNPRPSFISLEYSLADSGALVLVADNVKPKPGEEFNYTIVYKNDGAYPYNEADLKVIIPSEVDYVGANAEPNRVSGNIVEFKLGNILAGEQGAIVVIVKVKESISEGTNLIFTSVLGYKDKLGTQLATTSYMTVKVGPSSSASSSGYLLGLFSGSATLWLIALGLIVMMALISYRLIKWSRNGKQEIEDDFGFPKVPATFEPVGPAAPSYKR